MKIVTLNHPYAADVVEENPIVLAMGFFDGVHLAHQAVINKAKQIAQKKHLKLAVMTFDKHPKIIYQHQDEETFKYLSTLPRKEALMADLGVDILYVVKFNDDFARLTPQAFVDDYMVGLNTDTVVAGFDYTYGKKAIANMQTLSDFARTRFEIVTVNERDYLGEKIGSTKVRELLDHSQIKAANHLLGYVYQTTGKVVHGEARGRKLGFPTANIQSIAPEWPLGLGIYAVEIKIGDTWYQAMASIGKNVTFHVDNPVTVEINILDFNADIYGEIVTIKWHHYLRGEIKFESVTGLIAQLKADQKATLNYFKAQKENKK